MNRYVAEVSNDPGNDMYWHEWLVIETESPKDAVEKVLRTVSGDLYDGEEDVDYDANPDWDGVTVAEKVVEIKAKFAAAGIDAEVYEASCVFLGG